MSFKFPTLISGKGMEKTILFARIEVVVKKSTISITEDARCAIYDTKYFRVNLKLTFVKIANNYKHGFY